MLVLFINLSLLMEFQVRYLTLFLLFSVVDGFKWLQEYLVNAGVPKGSILFLQCIDDFPDDVFFDIAIYADDTTLYSKFDQASDLWQ